MVESIVSILFVSNAWASDQPEKYSIQNGENLSGISKTLFGDGTYWPKIWSKTGKKPHLMDSGHAIEFLLGSEDTAPSFAISETDDDSEALGPGPMIRPVASKSGSPVEIPPPKVKPKPVISLPPSLPEWQRPSARRTFQDYGVEVIPYPVINPETKFVVPVYVQDDEPSSVGTYISAVGEQGLAYEGREIFVKLRTGSGHIGARYLLIKNQGRLLKSAFKEAGDSWPGYVVKIAAEIEITERAEAKSVNDYEFFRARVLRSLDLSLGGSEVISGRVTFVSMSHRGPMSSVRADVIGGNFDSKGVYLGDHNFVFLNKGASDGVQVGQLMWVQSSPSSRDESNPFMVGVRGSALIKIARTSGSVSTGVIVRSSETVLQGDFTGPSQHSGTGAKSGPDDGTGVDLGSEELENF